MSNVGILTFHNADNYGAVMQAFALQETLKKYEAMLRSLIMIHLILD